MRLRRQAIVAGLALAWVGGASAQPAAEAAPSAEAMRDRSASLETFGPQPGIVREIVDPATGDRWLLLRDPDRPAGPDRLVLAGRGSRAPGATAAAAAHPGPARERPVIESGDRLRVEEHSPAVDTCLEAVALGSAVRGAYFRARLEIGGRVVRVEAVSPGHAVFGPETEVEP